MHMHCYRADEMLTILDMAEEFGYRVGTFHHGVEAYKVADELAANGVCGALWADWWGFKIEAYDGIQENIALVDRPQGGCAIVHSDSDEGIQRLNQEAAKAMLRGNRAGLDIPPERAIRWITSNAAKSLGIDDTHGSLAVGKMADVVLWNQDPFSVYAKPLQVYIDGVLRFEWVTRRSIPSRILSSASCWGRAMKLILMHWIIVAALLATMAAQAESLLITDGIVHVGDESAATVQDIYVKDGVIEAVSADLSALTADRIIDAGGRPVTPALFAGITGVGLSEIGMVYEAVDSRLNGLYTGLMHPEFDVRAAYNPHLERCARHSGRRLRLYLAGGSARRPHTLRSGSTGAVRRRL